MQNTIIDFELINLITLSGLKESFIAEQNNITPQYFSMLKTSARTGSKKREALKLWLVGYIKHSLNYKSAA
ncbi:MAG: hypothetical protein UZ05_CHB002002168 [Chlorobi bacterium OLB5]|nr:MAG: hypothetical protein UZ05_CHB002002168 [Chlorobi bacterium OLB5]